MYWVSGYYTVGWLSVTCRADRDMHSRDREVGDQQASSAMEALWIFQYLGNCGF